jgi:transcription initiation factor TFIIIB Brf1 subunit/transcription initiation factor TFIIB
MTSIMASSKLELFKEAQLLFEQEKSSDEDSIQDDDFCIHVEITNENGSLICIECGQLLQENCLIVQNNGGMKQRKRAECSLYNDIPFFISQKTKDKAIEMYKFVTGKSVYRTLRKAIILACLHRASIICEEPICFEELIKLIGIKTHKASRGVNFVSTNIPKDSEYNIPFFNDTMLIDSIMSTLGLSDHAHYIRNMIKLIKEKSDIFNTSHYKSVVCGCIFFWLKLNNLGMSLKQFSTKVDVSSMTVNKKYFIIKSVILKAIMPQLFSKLLLHCIPKYGKRITKFTQKNALIEPREKFVVYNHSDYTKLTVNDSDGSILPLDDVTNIEDWNLLLDVKYYDNTGIEYVLNVHLFVTNKDIILDFTKYNDRNKQDGMSLLYTILLQKIS